MTLRTRTLTTVVVHDDSLFPDEGALASVVNAAVVKAICPGGPDGRGVVSVATVEADR